MKKSLVFAALTAAAAMISAPSTRRMDEEVGNYTGLLKINNDVDSAQGGGVFATVQADGGQIQQAAGLVAQADSNGNDPAAATKLDVATTVQQPWCNNKPDVPKASCKS